MDRADLHKLVNGIAESELPAAQSFDEAPDDDEDSPEELLASIEQARQAAQQSDTISHQEMKRRYGLA